MKLKIVINGPRVHDVDYRHFLMNKAIACSIKMFEAYNFEGEKEQQVMIIVDGGEKEVDAFRKLAETKSPARAIVSNTVTEDYEGEVMRIEEYIKIFATFQMVEKAIPILLEMKDDIKSIKEDVKEIKWEVKDVIGEVKEMNTYVKNLTGM
jgi:acylphosphatase